MHRAADLEIRTISMEGSRIPREGRLASQKEKEKGRATRRKA